MRELDRPGTKAMETAIKVTTNLESIRGSHLFTVQHRPFSASSVRANS